MMTKLKRYIRQFMSARTIKALIVFSMAYFGVLTMPVYAGNITNMRIGQQVGSVRIVFEANSSFDYKAFLLNDPKRLVVDVYDMDIVRTAIYRTDKPRDVLPLQRFAWCCCR